ncbi:MAG TPA: helix-hairpin-helix domain-containing protein [Puia sp.]|nr:helix-hairpin-helix domain-containing protein [Puia sp.]
MSSLNPLSPTPAEKRLLRSRKLKFADLRLYSPKQLQRLLSIPLIRAMELRALSEFQAIPSIGPAFAHDLISLGFYSLKDLRKKNAARLTDRLEAQMGAWIDPCVEDQFRLVVHQANHGNSKKNWWDFTAERKEYRALYGYPASRPATAWYELPEYRKEERVAAKSAVAKKDIAAKLKDAMAFIKKNYTEAVSLDRLAAIACLSTFHFQRNFREVYEQSPLEVITHLRLKKACRLLRGTSLPIGTITIRSGFDDSSSFIRLFKKRFGQTPAAFRKARSPRVGESLGTE